MIICLVKVWVLLFSSFFVFSLGLVLELLDFGLKVLAVLVSERVAHGDNIFNRQMGDAVLLAEL